MSGWRATWRSRFYRPTYAADSDRLRRFDHEARVTAALNHPNILAVYDTGTHDGSPFTRTPACRRSRHRFPGQAAVVAAFSRLAPTARARTSREYQTDAAVAVTMKAREELRRGSQAHPHRGQGSLVDGGVTGHGGWLPRRAVPDVAPAHMRR